MSGADLDAWRDDVESEGLWAPVIELAYSPAEHGPSVRECLIWVAVGGLALGAAWYFGSFTLYLALLMGTVGGLFAVAYLVVLVGVIRKRPVQRVEIDTESREVRLFGFVLHDRVFATRRDEIVIGFDDPVSIWTYGGHRTFYLDKGYISLPERMESVWIVEDLFEAMSAGSVMARGMRRHYLLGLWVFVALLGGGGLLYGLALLMNLI